MALTEKQLLDKKKQVEEAKQEVSQYKGQQTAILKQLKDDWDCDSIEEAVKKGKKMNQEIETLTFQINRGIEELEEKFNV